MLGKIWKKALVFILIVACLFNIVRKIVRKNSLREELQATLDYFNARNQKVQENIVENNQINNNKQLNNNGTVENNYNHITVENNPIVQQTPAINNQENQQQVITNNQETQIPYTTTNPNEQQYVQQQNNDQEQQDLMPITQSEIEQNMQARMKTSTEQQINQ